LEIIRERKRVTSYYYMREFTDSPHCGLAFVCDEAGNVDFDSLNEAAKANYMACINGKYPTLKDRGAVKYSYQYTEPAIGICDGCGTEIELIDQYFSACQCPTCGAWYNLFGQAIKQPEHWEEQLDDDY